jgi:hypothetical protein
VPVAGVDHRDGGSHQTGQLKDGDAGGQGLGRERVA